MQSKASGKWATYLACVPQILQSLHQHTCTHSDTHTRIPNPPLLLTNERIITFADMWRGGGEAEQGGTVHFSKQEMNSPCCGHLSPREGRALAGCSVTQLPSKLQVWADTPVELAASLWSTSSGWQKPRPFAWLKAQNWWSYWREGWQKSHRQALMLYIFVFPFAKRLSAA